MKIYLKMIAIISFVILLNFVGGIYISDFYGKYDHITISFLLLMYLLFYLIDYSLHSKLTSEKLLIKDMIFYVLKFLIPISYALFMIVCFVESADKNVFLLHFLMYAILLMGLDTIINYQIIKKSSN